MTNLRGSRCCSGCRIHKYAVEPTGTLASGELIDAVIVCNITKMERTVINVCVIAWTHPGRADEKTTSVTRRASGERSGRIAGIAIAHPLAFITNELLEVRT